MIVILSTGAVLNLAHVAYIEPYSDNKRLCVKLACGQTEVIGKATEADYDLILESIIKEADDSTEGKAAHKARAQPRARAGSA